MSTYPPRGKCHRMLERLDDGDASFHELAALIIPDANAHKRHKLWHRVGSMLRDGLIGGARTNYYLTQPGRDALQALRAGKPASSLPQPTVRVFA